MRIRIYIDGRPSWTENQPSYARLPGHGGSLAVPASRPAKNAGLTPSQRDPEKVTPRKKAAA